METVSDTIEPTEAEASVLAELFSTTRRQSNLAILRAHVAAEVAKATGELLAENGRLVAAWNDRARFAFQAECEQADGAWRAKGEAYLLCAKQLQESLDAARAQQKDTP